MNRTQIAAIYDSFPESQRDMPRAQFIRETLKALDPKRMTAEVDAIVQRRIQGRINRVEIDRALNRAR